MIVQLFQCYDKTAETVSGPIMAFNREAPAIREFHAVLEMGDKTQPGRYPEQFVLVKIGQQETDTGVLDPYMAPQIVATGEEWLQQQEQQLQIQKARSENGVPPTSQMQFVR